MGEKIDRRTATTLLGAVLAVPAFGQISRRRTVAILLDSLTSEFWQASLEALKREATRRGWEVLEAVSNADDNRQYQQVLSMIRRGVDGIIIVHTDAKAVVPAIRAANAAAIPMVHFNRKPAPSDAHSVAVVADNRVIMHNTVAALIDEAHLKGGSYRAAILLGDLSDPNAIARRDGFHDAISGATDIVEVVAQIATEWNADKAFAGLTNALQAHPDINMLVSSSDFLTPQIEQALRTAGKWHPAGEPGHVLIASFDGDANAYAMLSGGYFDVDGVQNLNYEVTLTCDALTRLWAGETLPPVLEDPGLVVRGKTLAAQRDQMWGYSAWKAAGMPRNRALARRDTVAVASSASPGTVPLSHWNLSFLMVGVLTFLQAGLSFDNGRDLVLSMLPVAILASGQMLVLITGQIDLSITAIMALSSVLAASLMARMDGAGEPLQTGAGIIAALAIGVGIGLFNGACTALLRMPSFIVTLAVMMVGSGAAVWYASTVSDTMSIGGLPKAFVAIGYGSPAGIPVALVLCMLVLVLVQLLLSYTLLGRWLYAVGHNARVARIAGVPVTRVTIAVFGLSGGCAALAGIIYTARLETGQPTLGANMLLDIVGATVLGGVSLVGGRGNVWMVLGGVLVLSVLDKSLQLIGVSLFLVLAVKGIAILVAAIIDGARRARRRVV